MFQRLNIILHHIVNPSSRHIVDKHIRNVPNHELMVQLRSGYYSKKTEGKGPRLTYRQVRAVYEGLLALSYIEEERKGGYSKERGRGQSTRFSPTPKMLDKLKALYE